MDQHRRQRRQVTTRLGRVALRRRHHRFEAMGLPIGSGVVEGACKHVVGVRFKRKNTRGTKPRGRAVLHLRLDRRSGRWPLRQQLLRQAA